MRRMLFDERLDEGALAGAVRAHERHHFVTLEHHVHVAQQLAHARGRFDGHGHMLRFDHAIAAAIAGRQAQRHHAVTTDRRRQARHARQQLATSLGLLGVLTGQVPRDVLGFRRDLVLLLVELPLLREPAFFTLHEERLIAAFVGERRTAFEVQHVIGHHREKRTIVADADDGAIGVAQILLEPRRRFEIEVIRRFVEQQDFRRRGQLPRQRHAPAFTTTERTDAGGPGGLRIEADTHQHGVHLGGHLIATLAVEALEIAAVLLHRLLAVIVLEVGRLLGQRLLERAQIAEGAGHDLPQSHAVGEAAVLVHQRHAQSGHARHGAAGGQEVAGDQADQRGFSGAVAADHGPAVAGADGQRDVTKDLGRAEIHSRVPDRDKCHACAGRRCAKTVIRESNRTSTRREALRPRARSRPGARPANAAPATRARAQPIHHAKPQPRRPRWEAG